MHEHLGLMIYFDGQTRTTKTDAGNGTKPIEL